MDVVTAWQNIYLTLNSSLTDPESRGKKWIYGVFPDVYAKDFNGFPIIIVSPLSQSEKALVLKNDIKRKVFTCDIEIYSKKSSVADSLVNDVINACSSVSGLNIDLVESVTSGSVDFAGKPVHARTVICRWISYD